MLRSLVADSAGLAAAITGETGSGAVVFGTDPTLQGATVTFQYVDISMNRQQVFTFPDSNSTNSARFRMGHYRAVTSSGHRTRTTTKSSSSALTARPPRWIPVTMRTSSRAFVEFENSWNQNPVGDTQCNTSGDACEVTWEWNGNYQNASGTGYQSGGPWRWFDLAIYTDWNGASTNDGAEANPPTILEDAARNLAPEGFNWDAMQADCQDALDKIINVTDGQSCTVTSCAQSSVTCSGGLSGGAQFNAGDIYKVTRKPRGELFWNVYDQAAFDPSGNGAHFGLNPSTGMVHVGRGIKLLGYTDAYDAADTANFPQGYTAMKIRSM